VVDKCFGSTRAGTKQKALELVLEYVEVENGGEGCVVWSSQALNPTTLYSDMCLQRDILPGLGAKQPKIVAGCVTVLKEMIRYVA
jgi:cytoskeleton-associated protein 5